MTPGELITWANHVWFLVSQKNHSWFLAGCYLRSKGLSEAHIQQAFRVAHLHWDLWNDHYARVERAG